MAELVRDLMRHGAITCSLDTSVKEVAQIMVINRIRYVVVTDEHNAVAGIISARSILKAWGEDLEQTKAKDILLPYTVTTTPDTPLAEAIKTTVKEIAKIMDANWVRSVVVTDDRGEGGGSFRSSAFSKHGARTWIN